jgi:hypothetical protein
MRVFQKSVHKEWVNERLKENVFTFPFFHGDKTFRTCLKDITEMWKSHVENLINQVDLCFTKTMQSTQTIRGFGFFTLTLYFVTKGVSKTFWDKIQEKWMHDFGTMNHYLQEKYHIEEIMSDDFVEHLIPSLGLNNGNYAQFSSSMRDKLQKATNEWVKIKRQRSLHEHLQSRLLAPVRAVWCVEKKTFTDMVLKICRDSIINRVAYWVETQLLTDRDIRDVTVEDSSLHESRKQLNTTIDNI